jgi:alkylresorcinol/alkylpyrone synthase
MPRLVSVATAVPATRIEQSVAAGFARAKFAAALPDLERLMPLFTHAGIETRYFAVPQEWFFEHHDLAERSARYVTEATRLSEQAATAALEQAGLAPLDIDYIIYVNTTGLATPSIDARLINRLGLRPDVRRTPIWGLGCAGGVAGLSHAFHYALAHRGARILVVATELCGLTFLPDDMSKANLVATALFADGAAAAIVSGDEHAGAGLEILGTRSRLYPDSLDVMGWTVLQEGLQVVFAQRIPDIVRDTAAAEIGAFLATYGHAIADVDAFLLHPGGTKSWRHTSRRWRCGRSNWTCPGACCATTATCRRPPCSSCWSATCASMASPREAWAWFRRSARDSPRNRCSCAPEQVPLYRLPAPMVSSRRPRGHARATRPRPRVVSIPLPPMVDPTV